MKMKKLREHLQHLDKLTSQQLLTSNRNCKNVMREQRRKLEEQLAEIKESTDKLERVKESLIRKKIGSNKRFSHIKYLDDEFDHEGNE